MACELPARGRQAGVPALQGSQSDGDTVLPVPARCAASRFEEPGRPRFVPEVPGLALGGPGIGTGSVSAQPAGAGRGRRAARARDAVSEARAAAVRPACPLGPTVLFCTHAVSLERPSTSRQDDVRMYLGKSLLILGILGNADLLTIVTFTFFVWDFCVW